MGNFYKFGLFRIIFFSFFSLTFVQASAQNIFGGEPVQVVGQMNGYSTAASSNSTFRRVSFASGTTTDGRGQWVRTYNVQSSGGDFTPINMPGGNGSGFMFISGPSSGGNCGGRFNNRWNFSGVGSAALNSVNGISSYSNNCAGTDMGLNMSTAGRYTFVFNDVGYTGTNARFYVGYTANAPVTVTRSSQVLNFNRTATINIATGTTPSSGENVYVRFTTASDFSSTNSSSFVQATGSGTSWSATIPAQAIGSTVRYYVLTSTVSLATLNSMSEIDKSLSVLNFDHNSGNNYQYTLTNSFTSTQTGNFSASATWGGNQPFEGASYTIANTHTVTLDIPASVSGLTINGGGAFENGTQTLTINASGTLTNNGTFTRNTGTVAFSGTGTVSGTVGFNNVSIAGGVIFGTASTINGILTINSGGFVNTNAPTYANGSTLRYNTGSSVGSPYGRGLEWSTTSGPGYPHHVQISGSTALDVNNGANAARQIAGDLTVDAGSTLTLAGMTSVSFTTGLTITGNVSNSGTITLATSTEAMQCAGFTNNSGSSLTLSSNSGGDIIITGNFSNSGTFTHSNRAVFLRGGTAQTLSGTFNGTTTTNCIPFLIVDKSANGVTLGSPVNVTNTLTLTAGVITTTPSNVLNVNATGTGAISGGSATAYISGPLQRSLPASLLSGSTYVFPVGNADGYYPFSLVNPTTSTAASITATAFFAGSGGSNGTGITAVSGSEYWSVASTGGFTNSSYSLTRPTAVSPNNVIGRSTSLAGPYNSIFGTASGTSISNSSVASGAAQQFFVLAQGALPSITVTGTLSNFGDVCTSANSNEQTYTVSGNDLTADVVVTAPTGFQVSTTSGSGFGSSVTLGRTGSDLTGEPVTIFVRFSPSATGGASGNITHTSTGATTQNQAVAGTGIATPATPGSITGSTNPCASSTGNSYSIAAVSGATSYTWTVPAGWNITAGQGGTSVTVTAGTSGGNITVTATNTCGTSSAQSLAVTVNTIPATPGSITGSATVCPSSANTYSIAAVPGATSYTWTLPGGWTGTSTTNSINTTSGASGGTISVTANNACGSSAPQTLSVTVSGSVGGTATATAATVCPGGSTTITLTGHTGTIQWQRNTSTPAVWTNIAGATSATLTTGPVNLFTQFRAVVTSGSCASANSGTASVSVSDLNTSTAAPTVYNAWDNGDNDATAGFGAWALTGGTNAGFFTGATTDNDDFVPNLPNSNTGGRGWGMFANSGQTASAIRPITGNLSIGQTLTYSMDNGSVQTGTPSPTVGMGLQNASGNNLMELYFQGGQTVYTVNDAAGPTNTTIGFTRGGLEVTITRTAAATYTIRIVRKEDGSSQTLTGRTFSNPAGGQVPAQVRFFNFNAGSGAPSNAYFNSLGIGTPLVSTQPSTGTQTLNLGQNGTAISVTASGTVTTYQWYRNTTNSNSGGTAVGTNAASHTPNETSPGTYYYYATVTGACGSATSNPSGAITVNNTNVWTGGTGNWNVGSNWSSGSVPTGDQVIEINNGTPTLNVNFAVTTGSLTLNSPSTLIIGPGATLSKTGGTIDFNGNLVTIRSTSGGSGSIGTIVGSAIADATNITVERYILAKRAWRMLTAPLTGTTNNSIFINWQNNGNTGSGVNIWAPAPTGVATPSSSNSGIQLGGVSSSIIRYNSSSNSWSAVTSTNSNTLFGAANGSQNPYAIFVTGPFGTGSITGAAVATTLRATGTLQQGLVQYTNLASGQFHMIGNPYASPVNLSGTTTTPSISNAFYVWDAQGTGLGQYRTWEDGAWLAAPTGSNYSNAPIVQSGQAFFVYAQSGTNSVTINESNKVSNNTNNVGFRTYSTNDQRLRIGLNRIVNNVPEERDVALARFDATYSAEVDGADIVKANNFSENLSLFRSGTNLVVERRSMLQPNDTLFLRLWNTAATNYELAFSYENFQLPAGTTIILRDLFTNTERPLTAGITEKISFAVTADANSTGQRFQLVFRTNTVTPVRDLNGAKGFAVYPNPVAAGSRLQLEFRNRTAGNYQVVLFNITGSQVLQRTVQHGGGTAVQAVELPSNLAAGTYIAEITSSNGVKEQVKVTIQ